jgi:integrase
MLIAVGEIVVEESIPLLHLKKARILDTRFHDLRHTCATLLLGWGVHPKYVQELLGHAAIAMTLDTHAHYQASMGYQGAGAMGDALG